MATPNPSRVATVGAVVGKVITEASKPTRASPANTLNNADSNGITAATTDPNMNSSNTNAHDKPMISDARSSVVCPICPAPPPYSTCNPAARAGATASSS